MLKIKDKYKGKTLSSRKVNIVIDEMDESSYQKYYDAGYDYLFDEVNTKVFDGVGSTEEPKKKKKTVMYRGTKKNNKKDDSNSESGD